MPEETPDGTVDKVLDSASDIATTSIHQAGEIVSGAGEILKGDVSGGVDRIMKAVGEISSNAAHEGTQIAKDIAGQGDDAS